MSTKNIDNNNIIPSNPGKREDNSFDLNTKQNRDGSELNGSKDRGIDRDGNYRFSEEEE